MSVLAYAFVFIIPCGLAVAIRWSGKRKKSCWISVLTNLSKITTTP